ncbi:endolytic transglycosylase MltG [Winogradskya humida]|uniref:Endolytic murein transglycosylase n=1 Tax=Winogradskya humida TaxID=113566 RepID=A0ABQ3ZY79_9ACTN|nr:endolytic transglycosylase MltG [Actinoplanes humidus]GIE23515.1 hypothetical protein Ahu01nite_066170 [Actinoplanes humidus]
MSDERYRSRHRRPGEGRAPIALLVVVVLVGVLGIGGYLGRSRIQAYLPAADYDGAGTEAVQVTIAQHSTLTTMGDTLVTKDVVQSTRAFVDAADANPKGQNIGPGTYNLKKHMSGAAAVTLLLDPKARVVNGVPIPEGTTANGVYAILAESTGLKVDDFKKAAKDPKALGVPDLWFERTDGQRVTKSIEGFLFPATYEFPKKGTAAEYLKLMVKQFMTVADSINFVKRAEDDRKISPYEVLTVASLSQAEAGNKDDLGKVSRTAYNRLYGDNSDQLPCKCLEYDVGINYYYQLTGKPTKPSGKMTRAELRDPKNPYRLHDKEGLTPTPINNPGKAALEGALDPPKGDWLFFVATDKQGHSVFTRDYQKHLQNIETSKKNGVL